MRKSRMNLEGFKLRYSERRSYQMKMKTIAILMSTTIKMIKSI